MNVHTNILTSTITKTHITSNITLTQREIYKEK